MAFPLPKGLPMNVMRRNDDAKGTYVGNQKTDCGTQEQEC